MPIDNDGPFLAAAVLCDRVLEEKDGVSSIIRIIDRFIITGGPEAPERMPKAQLNTILFLAFKSGFVKGSFNVRVVLNTPNGKDASIASVPILLEGDDRGANLHLRLGLEVDEPGLYWLNVLLQEDLMTRVPLRLIYQRISQGTA